MCYQTASELVAALASQKISSLELVETAIARIELFDNKINAVVVRDFERARIAAQAADAALARGERLPLLGLPVTVKESLNVAGLVTSWGNVNHRDWQPNADALVIERLKDAGAIILGKTNVPFMLKEWQTFNDIYGTTNNPWDVHRTAGGSSGGSAAALAAGFVALEVGSDFCGSLRVPASFCGVFAHKPSANLVPLRGAGPPTAPLWPSMADFPVVGPLARSAADLTLALDVLAGPDEQAEGIGYRLVLPPSRHNRLQKFRVLVLDQHPLFPTSTAVTQAITHFAEQLAELGVTLVNDISAPLDLAEIARNYSSLFLASGMADTPFETQQMLHAKAQSLPADDRSLAACRLRGLTMSHGDWLTAMRVRERLRQQWRELMKQVDIVLCPVMPTPAFPHDHNPDFTNRKLEVDGQQLPYGDQLVWLTLASLLGIPSTVMPIAHSETKLPVGIQIMSGYLEDHTTIAFAELVERTLGGFIPPIA